MPAFHSSMATHKITEQALTQLGDVSVSMDSSVVRNTELFDRIFKSHKDKTCTQ